MDEDSARSVIVGVDGSRGGLAAVGLAASEAVLRRLPLTLVHALGRLGGSYRPPSRQLGRGGAALIAAASRVHAEYPELLVRTHLANGHPSARLVAASIGAALVVAGQAATGHTSMLTGSIGARLCANARCPVIIARRRMYPDLAAPVVVGVDGSASSRSAAVFAFEEAALRGVPLLALYAHADDCTGDAHDGIVTDTIDGLARRFPDVELHPTTVPGVHAAEALLFASTAASLVVVGSRGLGSVRGPLLGSVSRGLIHNAHCPVAVVRFDEQIPPSTFVARKDMDMLTRRHLRESYCAIALVQGRVEQEWLARLAG